jgi:1-acyl-sn-glycerol-3-phosphate acyltransferase
MKIKANALAEASCPRVATYLLKGFSAYSRNYVRRHFHSIRILKNGLPPPDISCPVVIYLNHASWWDPLVCLHLARKYFGNRRSFAPIDEASLQRYGFFKQLGFYGVEQKSARGAITFLRTTCKLLGSARNMVWLTPQGRFMDVRQRPLRLQPGIGSLAARMENIAFVPLAIEYTLWTEPRPEILLGFGCSTVPKSAPLRSSREWTEFFTNVLEKAQDELAAKSSQRDPADWIVLDRGKSGINAIYDTWRWLRLRIRSGGFARGRESEDRI